VSWAPCGRLCRTPPASSAGPFAPTGSGGHPERIAGLQRIYRCIAVERKARRSELAFRAPPPDPTNSLASRRDVHVDQQSTAGAGGRVDCLDLEPASPALATNQQHPLSNGTPYPLLDHLISLRHLRDVRQPRGVVGVTVPFMLARPCLADECCIGGARQFFGMSTLRMRAGLAVCSVRLGWLTSRSFRGSGVHGMGSRRRRGRRAHATVRPKSAIGANRGRLHGPAGRSAVPSQCLSRRGLQALASLHELLLELKLSPACAGRHGGVPEDRPIATGRLRQDQRLVSTTHAFRYVDFGV
jgi:hypothetical protein